MVNKCAVFGCKRGYESKEQQNYEYHAFYFPSGENKEHLLPAWVKFVNRKDWKPTKNSVICEFHFEGNLINKGNRWTLKWKVNPVPTLFTDEMNESPKSLQPPHAPPPRKPPMKRNYQEDEINTFLSHDIIKDFSEIDEKHAPTGFSCKKTNDHVVFFNLSYVDGFPVILESIKVDKNLNVQLQFNGHPVPLPAWFTKGRNASLTHFSQLNNFPNSIRVVSADSETSRSLLNEMLDIVNYQPKGRPPYSSVMIRFALHLRYTSLQSYKILLEKFPLPSISTLHKIQKGGVDAIKAAKKLREEGRMSSDVILMVDEMYLQKGTSYQGGEYIGEDETGELYKGIVCFMIVGMKKSIPYVIQAIPEVSINGTWLADKISASIESLAKTGFIVRGVVTDNHSANVNAFNTLKKRYGKKDQHFIQHPANHKGTFLFFDTPHLVKNVRNNLLNARRFVFPQFDYEKDGIQIHCPAGYIAWSDLHKIFECDARLQSNLKKAHKLSYQALHPGNNKQSVSLALGIFHETTRAACNSYFPDRQDVSEFLKIIDTWWLICNSKEISNPNPLGDAIKAGDGKTEFLEFFANWLEEWREDCPMFTLTNNTSKALVMTLRAQSELIKELLSEDYEFVMTSRLQSDPVERRFSQYRQMSGGRFLVSLREVQNSERILRCRSLIKEDINFWKDDLGTDKPVQNLDALITALNELHTEIMEATLDEDSVEVSTTISGYIAKKLAKRSKCDTCNSFLIANQMDLDENHYLNILSRGGLIVPSSKLAEYTSNCFAILDYTEDIVRLHAISDVRGAFTHILEAFASKSDFCCPKHINWGMKFASKIIINTFFNNKQTVAADLARKDSVIGFKKRQRAK